jgi:hypothetical protein
LSHWAMPHSSTIIVLLGRGLVGRAFAPYFATREE